MQRPVVLLPQPDSPTSAERLAGSEVEADAVDRVHAFDFAAEPAAVDREVLDQVLHLEQRRAHGDTSFGAGRRRRCSAPCAPVWVRAGPASPPCIRAPHSCSAPRSGSLGRVDQLGHGARDLLEPHLVQRGRVDARDRADQALGVGMARVREQRLDARLLDDLPGIHHDDALRHLGDDAHRVRDQHDRHAEALLQLAEQVEDLRLDGDVERGGRLVGDQQLGIAGQGAIAIITRWRMPPENWCG